MSVIKIVAIFGIKVIGPVFVLRYSQKRRYVTILQME